MTTITTVEQPFSRHRATPAPLTVQAAGSDHRSRINVAPFSQHLLVSGIDIALLRLALAGRDWRNAWGGQPTSVLADQPGAVRIPANSEPHRQVFPDGKLWLQSGCPGRLEPRRADNQPLFMPRSLSLLLAQQWARCGLLPVHAAVLEMHGRGVLVLAGKGSGKSVLSLAALVAGGRVVSDDWVLLGMQSAERAWATRLRDTLLLRESWAVKRLIQHLPDCRFRPWPGRPKYALDLADGNRLDPRFPAGCGIDAIWLLNRARGSRARRSVVERVHPARALAALIQSSSPLLFGTTFPVERQSLMRMASKLIDGSTCHAVATGTDLVNQPESEIARLAETARVATGA